MYQFPRLGKRELICLLLFTSSCVVSVRRGFLFLWVLGMGCVIFIVALPEPSILLFCTDKLLVFRLVQSVSLLLPVYMYLLQKSKKVTG